MICFKPYIFALVALIGLCVYFFFFHFIICINGTGGVTFKDMRGSPLYFNEGRELEFYFWDARPSQCSPDSYLSIYSDVKCHYKINSESEFKEIKASFIKEHREHDGEVNKVAYKCIIPPIIKKQGINSLDFFVSYTYAGEYKELRTTSELFVKN